MSREISRSYVSDLNTSVFTASDWHDDGAYDKVCYSSRFTYSGMYRYEITQEVYFTSIITFKSISDFFKNGSSWFNSSYRHMYEIHINNTVFYIINNSVLINYGGILRPVFKVTCSLTPRKAIVEVSKDVFYDNKSTIFFIIRKYIIYWLMTQYSDMSIVALVANPRDRYVDLKRSPEQLTEKLIELNNTSR